MLQLPDEVPTAGLVLYEFDTGVYNVVGATPQERFPFPPDVWLSPYSSLATSPDRTAIAYTIERGPQDLLIAQSIGPHAGTLREWPLPDGYWIPIDWLSDFSIAVNRDTYSGQVYLTTGVSSELRVVEPSFPMSSERGKVYLPEHGPRYTPALDRVIVKRHQEGEPIWTTELWDASYAKLL